jgi:hypothetical protein
MAVIESTEKRNFIHMLKLTCTVPHASTVLSHTTAKWITGYVDRVVFVPSAVATPPASGFDFTLTDNDGVDILKGGGSSCSATLTTDLYPDYSLNSKLTLAIGAAGTNGSQGYIKIFWRESENG